MKKHPIETLLEDIKDILKARGKFSIMNLEPEEVLKVTVHHLMTMMNLKELTITEKEIKHHIKHDLQDEKLMIMQKKDAIELKIVPDDGEDEPCENCGQIH